MKHIITVQHTQSIHHTNGMVGSWTDWDLTEQRNLGKCCGKSVQWLRENIESPENTIDDRLWYL